MTDKPSVAEDLVKALLNGRAERHDGCFSSGDLTITYCRGHLVRLAEPEDYPNKAWAGRWNLQTLPIVPDDLEFLYKPNGEGAAKQLAIIGKLARQAEIIVKV